MKIILWLFVLIPSAFWWFVTLTNVFSDLPTP